MFTKEQGLFLKALSDFINKNGRTIVSEDISTDVLFSYGKKHEVLAIIYYQTKLPDLLKTYSSTIYSYTNRMNMIKNLLHDFNFQYFIVKGISVSDFYPVPSLRTMGDIDIVVHSEHRELVHKIFLEQGYECKSKLLDREWQYYKDNMEFELHDHLIYRETINNSKQEVFLNNFWPYVNGNVLDWNFHFLFLISHLRKHFMNEGVGFRMFMDIAVVAKYRKLDWKWIEEKSEEIELLAFLKTVLAFIYRWFHIITPLQSREITDDFYETSTIKIFEDGIFGFDNLDNACSDAVNLFRREGKIGALKATIKQIFPSYSLLKTVPAYNFIAGKPYLIPVAWVYRFFKNCNKKGAVKEKLNKTIASAENIEKRESLYNQWGL